MIEKSFLDTVMASFVQTHLDLLELEYSKNDVRYKTSAYINGIIRSYYVDLCLLNTLFERKQLASLQAEFGHPDLDLIQNDVIKSHVFSLNRNYMLDIWNTFEPFITTIFESEIDKETKEKYENEKAIKLVKRLNPLSPDDREYIYRALKTRLIPFDIKFNKVLKLAKKSYSRSTKNDRAFVEFFCDLRNSQHMNFVYRGNRDYEYKFNDTLFTFKNGLPFDENDLTNPSDRPLSALLLRFEFFLTFYNIVREISRSVHTDFIKSYVVYADNDL